MKIQFSTECAFTSFHMREYFTHNFNLNRALQLLLKFHMRTQETHPSQLSLMSDGDNMKFS